MHETCADSDSILTYWNVLFHVHTHLFPEIIPRLFRASFSYIKLKKELQTFCYFLLILNFFFYFLWVRRNLMITRNGRNTIENLFFTPKKYTDSNWIKSNFNQNQILFYFLFTSHWRYSFFEIFLLRVQDFYFLSSFGENVGK